MAERTYPRLLRAPRGSFFLFGVRGVGKTTWIREALPDAYVVDLLDESRYQQLAANPGLLAAELRTVPRDRAVVLDEVQRVPALLNEVQRAVERAPEVLVEEQSGDGEDDGHRQAEGSRKPQPNRNAAQPPSARSRYPAPCTVSIAWRPNGRSIFSRRYRTYTVITFERFS